MRIKQKKMVHSQCMLIKEMCYSLPICFPIKSILITLSLMLFRQVLTFYCDEHEMNTHRFGFFFFFAVLSLIIYSPRHEFVFFNLLVTVTLCSLLIKAIHFLPIDPVLSERRKGISHYFCIQIF